MRYYIKYFKKYMPLIIAALSCVFCEAICDLLQPTMMSKIIDNGIKNSSVDVVIHYGLTMFFISIAGMCFAISRNILASKVAQSFGADLRLDTFEKVMKLSEKSTDKIGSGSLLTRLTNDTSQIVQFAHGMMRVFFKAPLTCIGAIVLAVILSPKLSLVMFTAIIFVTIFISISMKLSYSRFRKVQIAIDRINTVVQEYLLGIRLVKTFGRFQEEEIQFDGANSGLSNKTIKSQLVIAIFSPLMTFVINIGIIGIFFLGSFLFVENEIEVGKISAFISYMTQILTSLIMITNIFNTFVRTKASASRINEIMECDEDTDISDYYSPENFSTAKITFDNVTFSYPNGSGIPAVKNLSFEIEKNKTMSIIGSTGSGKSTVAWLMLRFYPLNSGIIKLNDYDINTISLENYREYIAIAPQKSMLFSGTVKENIMWGESNADFETIENAANNACASSFINNMPNGYDSILGQSGVNLSGGQKQRISIARAIIKNAPVLILDDCMSAVDSVTESVLRKNLNKYLSTKIIITQKITTAMNADKILVMENGTSAGFGTHKELLRDCQIYKDIYESQIGKD